MALTLAQRTQLRKRAAAQADTSAPSMDGATTYELQLAQLTQHRQQLKQIQSSEGKAKVKAEILGDYEPYVSGVLAAGSGAQDEVLTTVMIWRIDAGDYAGALDIADYVLRHGLLLPDRFERTPGCLVAEEIANAALSALKLSAGFDLDLLARTDTLTAAQDMPDEVRAKLRLAQGRGELARVDEENLDAAAGEALGRAEGFLSRAIELHERCGGKKDLERTQRLLKKTQKDDSPPPSATGADAAADTASAATSAEAATDAAGDATESAAAPG